jgi:hypothetical protein
MGVWDRQARGAGHRIWLRGAAAPGLIGLAVLIGLASCGSAPSNAASSGRAKPAATASQVRSATGGTLCAETGSVHRLTVSRVNALPVNHPNFSFPATVAVSDAAQARAVARALCAPQPLPRGVVACPADLGITYRLDFATSRRSLPPVAIRAGGCEGVSGAGLTRWSIRTPAFWTVLGTAMGLAHPGHAAFSGSMQP